MSDKRNTLNTLENKLNELEKLNEKISKDLAKLHEAIINQLKSNDQEETTSTKCLSETSKKETEATKEDHVGTDEDFTIHPNIFDAIDAIDSISKMYGYNIYDKDFPWCVEINGLGEYMRISNVKSLDDLKDDIPHNYKESLLEEVEVHYPEKYIRIGTAD